MNRVETIKLITFEYNQADIRLIYGSFRLYKNILFSFVKLYNFSALIGRFSRDMF